MFTSTRAARALFDDVITSKVARRRLPRAKRMMPNVAEARRWQRCRSAVEIEERMSQQFLARIEISMMHHA